MFFSIARGLCCARFAWRDQRFKKQQHRNHRQPIKVNLSKSFEVIFFLNNSFLCVAGKVSYKIVTKIPFSQKNIFSLSTKYGLMMFLSPTFKRVLLHDYPTSRENMDTLYNQPVDLIE